MSVTTLSYAFSGDSPTAVVLTDDPAARVAPDPGYGVKRTDNNAVVVAAGTAMTEAPAGIWNYSFTDPLAGLTYLISVQYAFSDGTIGYFTDTKTSAVHAVTPTDLQRQFGSANIIAWADKDNTGDPTIISAAIDYWLTLADKRIAVRAQELRAPIPAVGSALYAQLQDFETTYAGVGLYEGRGEPTNGSRGPDGAGPYTAMMSDAEDKLTACLLASRDLTGVTGTNVAAPRAIGSGTNTALADRLPLQPYGLRFGWGYGRWPY